MISLGIRGAIEVELTSGVRSRVPKPVPPVVTIQSTSPWSHQASTTVRMRISSSGTICKCVQMYPLCVKRL